MSQVAVDDSSHTNTTFTHLAKAKKEDGPLKIVGFEPLAKRRKAADRNATFLIWLCLILALIPLIWVLATVIIKGCLLYTSPSPRDKRQSRMPSSA